MVGYKNKILNNCNSDITDADIENWREIEVELSKKTFNVPIYFTWQDDTLTV